MTLTLLPDDVLLEFLGCTLPLDIIALGETCKDLHRISSQRCVWERLIRRMCRERGLFLTSFPLPEMTLHDLQRAVLAPDLWKRIVQRHSQLLNSLEPASPLNRRSALPGKRVANLDYFAELALVPGGRYLFAASFESYDDGSPTVLALYDLGVPGTRTSGASHLISTYKLRSRCFRSTHSFKASVDIADDSSLNVVVFSKPLSANRTANPAIDYIVTALSISPNEDNPTFTLLSTISVVGGTDLSRSEMRPPMSSGQALLDMGDGFLVWAYKDNWYKAWHCQTDGLLLRELPTFTGRFVIAHGHDSVAIWDVDDRQTLDIPANGLIRLRDEERSQHLPPDYTVKYPLMERSVTITRPMEH